jgi:hypothetical protein
MFFKHPKLFDENLLRYADDLVFKFAGSLRAIQQNVDNDCLPTAGDDAQRPFDRQARKFLRDPHLTNQIVCRLIALLNLFYLLPETTRVSIHACTIRSPYTL